MGEALGVGVGDWVGTNVGVLVPVGDWLRPEAVKDLLAEAERVADGVCVADQLAQSELLSDRVREAKLADGR